MQMQSNQPRQLTCFKCGKNDHFSRDCTAPPSEWIKRDQSQNAAATPGLNGMSNAGKENAVPRPIFGAKATNKRPKLEMDHFQDPRLGLPVVFLTFRDRFKKIYKGRGHEASDLRRLLEMYRDWQRRLLPGMDLDDFIAASEKLGNTNRMKKEMRELRDGAIDVLANESDPLDMHPVAEEAGGGSNTNVDDPDEPQDELPLPLQAAEISHKETADEADLQDNFDPFDDVVSPEKPPDEPESGFDDMDGVDDELMEEFY